MRDFENFKSYVYEKADVTRAIERKKKKRLLRLTAAAASFCVVFFAVLYAIPHLQPKNGANMLYMNTESAESPDLDGKLGFAYAASPYAGAVGSVAAQTAQNGFSISLDALSAALALFDDRLALWDDSTFDADKRAANDIFAENYMENKETDVFTVHALFHAAPEIMHCNVGYADSLILIVLYTDRTPMTSGSYALSYDVELDPERFHGQPIKVIFQNVNAQ